MPSLRVVIVIISLSSLILLIIIIICWCEKTLCLWSYYRFSHCQSGNEFECWFQPPLFSNTMCCCILLSKPNDVIQQCYTAQFLKVIRLYRTRPNRRWKRYLYSLFLVVAVFVLIRSSLIRFVVVLAVFYFYSDPNYWTDKISVTSYLYWSKQYSWGHRWSAG